MGSKSLFEGLTRRTLSTPGTIAEVIKFGGCLNHRRPIVGGFRKPHPLPGKRAVDVQGQLAGSAFRIRSCPGAFSKCHLFLVKLSLQKSHALLKGLRRCRHRCVCLGTLCVFVLPAPLVPCADSAGLCATPPRPVPVDPVSGGPPALHLRNRC